MNPDVNVHGVLNVMRHVLPAMVVAHTAAPKKTKAGYVDKVDRTKFFIRMHPCIFYQESSYNASRGRGLE